MARSARFDKTNALRELDSAGIAYTVETYEADDGIPGRDYGVHVAELLGVNGTRERVCDLVEGEISLLASFPGKESY